MGELAGRTATAVSFSPENVFGGEAVSFLGSPAAALDLRRRRTQMNAMINAARRATAPPTAPPIMAPRLVDLGAGVEVFVDVGFEVEVEVVRVAVAVASDGENAKTAARAGSFHSGVR